MSALVLFEIDGKDRKILHRALDMVQLIERRANLSKLGLMNKVSVTIYCPDAESFSRFDSELVKKQLLELFGTVPTFGARYDGTEDYTRARKAHESNLRVWRKESARSLTDISNGEILYS